MKPTFRKLLSSALTLTTSISLAGVGLAGTAYASQLTEAKATLSVVRAAQTSNHTISFKVASTTSIGKVELRYRTTASTGTTTPQDLITTAATNGGVSIAGSTDTSNWTIGVGTNSIITYTATTPTGSLTAGNVLSFQASGITNNATTGANLCDSVTNSETCFIRITTYAADNTTVVDTSVTTYTVIDSVTVTATVDPILTFTVAGVSSGTTSDANAGATSVTTTATTVPFGNVTLGSAKVATQSLTVLTNANNGYNVYGKFVGVGPSTDQLMVGTYSANNIDPFAATSGWAEDSGTPAAWITPTGTAGSVDTGWLGMRTNNTGVAGFGTSNVWAPPYVGNSIGKKVMVSSTPDNGATPTYVSYKIQANAYQPSDTYSGIAVYNVVASY